MKSTAIKYFMTGYSCSESIVKAAYEKRIISIDYSDCLSGFSHGLSSGCLCGAIAGSASVIGFLHGKSKTNTAREKTQQLIESFKKANLYTCCKLLSKGYEDDPQARKQHCKKFVEYSCILLEEILDLNKTGVSK